MIDSEQTVLRAKRVSSNGLFIAASRMGDAGQLFGTEGWTRRENPDSGAMDFVKAIEVVIENADWTVFGIAPTDVNPAVFEVAAQQSAA